MDRGVKGRRCYKDKLKIRTKARMQSDQADLLTNTEREKYVKNYKPLPLDSSEPRKIVEIMNSDETALSTNTVIDKDSVKNSSVKYIHQILDDVLSSVINLATDYTGIRLESKLVEAKEVEEGEIVNDDEDPDELIETWMSDVSNDETCFNQIFTRLPNSSRYFINSIVLDPFSCLNLQQLGIFEP